MEYGCLGSTTRRHVRFVRPGSTDSRPITMNDHCHPRPIMAHDNPGLGPQRGLLRGGSGLAHREGRGPFYRVSLGRFWDAQ